MESQASITALLDIMRRLRDPQTGCPWDLAQDFTSIAPYTIEEAYEVDDAIERQDMEGLKSELGDLLFQVVFHARMAQEQHLFDFNDVVAAVCDKMERRHPHIFAAADNRSASEQTKAWEDIKAQERQKKAQNSGETPSILDDVPLPLPALTRAVKLQKRAARVGFDWPQAKQVIDKLHEEQAELSEALCTADNTDHIEEEFGDILFVYTNLARKLGIDPERALRRANGKFMRRFQWIEHYLATHNEDIEKAGLDRLESLWQLAKEDERA